MANLYLVRHGTAAARWGTDPDPPLSDGGRKEAEALPDWFRRQGLDQALPVVASPMQRAQQTAEPLAEHWQTEVAVEPRMIEVPSPKDPAIDRRAWITATMQKSWPEIDAPAMLRWRREIIAYLKSLNQDHVIVSHFVAINVAVGAALGQDALVVFRPSTASVTVLKSDATSGLALVSLGNQGESEVR